MKINQYCSVCKQHLDMEVIPTDDAGDDGVIWLRCPECMGFLPKFSGEGLKPRPAAKEESPPAGARAGAPSDRSPGPDAGPAAADSPTPDAEDTTADAAADAAADDEPAAEKAAAAERTAEPIAEYKAQLDDADLAAARPYRPTAAYAIGDVVHHLAYDDIGVVVAKESLPGGRLAVKVFFEKAGVVRLIEQATDGA